MCIKIFSNPSKKGDSSEKNAIAQMIGLLSEISIAIKDASEKDNKQLINIEKALCGDGETTLLTQLQKLRASFNDKQDEMITEFRSFTQTMAENNYNALIAALKEVIKDFNAKINEQFGDNFKHLNEGVAKMLEWQENYKEQIEDNANYLKICLEDMQLSNESMKKVIDKAQVFGSIAGSLDKTIGNLDTNLTKVQVGIESFANMADKAENAFPIIETNIKKLTSSFSQKVTHSLNETEKMINIQNEGIKSQVNLLTKTHENVNEQISQAYTSLNNNIESLMQRSTTRLEEQILKLDNTLNEELNRSLKSLGGQLTSLSQKFVNDYSPLTDKLRNVLQLVEGVN